MTNAQNIIIIITAYLKFINMLIFSESEFDRELKQGNFDIFIPTVPYGKVKVP